LRARSAGLGAVLALLAGGAFAASAEACDIDAHHRSARGGAPGGPAPLVIGDSTMIFAAPVLGRLGLEADAHGCRSFADGVRMLAARKRAGRLPHVAVLALGANGAADASHISQALAVMGRGRVLALVTPRNTAGAQAAMRRAAARHPDRVLLVDWVAYSAGHDGWFAGDGLHVTHGGAKEYARLIRRRIAPFAFPPTRELRMPAAVRGTPGCGTVRRAGRRLRVRVTKGRERIGCRRARALAAGPALRPAAGWRAYDLRAVRRTPWDWAVARRDGKVVVGIG
jgi:hypothetical protein